MSNDNQGEQKDKLEQLLIINKKKALIERKRYEECRKRNVDRKIIIRIVKKIYQTLLKILRITSENKILLHDNNQLLLILIKTTANGNANKILEAWRESKKERNSVVVEQGQKNINASSKETKIGDIN